MNHESPAGSEQQPSTPFYRRPEVIERAQNDERLANQLHGLELADKGRQISQELHTQMELGVSEYLLQAHPDIAPNIPPTDQSI
jgi:hypothetical protein